MQFELRPAVYEFLALLRVTLVAPESRTTRACGLGVLLLLPFFALLAMMANRPDNADEDRLHALGEWEKVWAVERYPGRNAACSNRPAGERR